MGAHWSSWRLVELGRGSDTHLAIHWAWAQGACLMVLSSFFKSTKWLSFVLHAGHLLIIFCSPANVAAIPQPFTTHGLEQGEDRTGREQEELRPRTLRTLKTLCSKPSFQSHAKVVREMKLQFWASRFSYFFLSRVLLDTPVPQLAEHTPQSAHSCHCQGAVRACRCKQWTQSGSVPTQWLSAKPTTSHSQSMGHGGKSAQLLLSEAKPCHGKSTWYLKTSKTTKNHPCVTTYHNSKPSSHDWKLK